MPQCRYYLIQGDSRENVNISAEDNIGHCEKSVRVNMGLILNGYRREREREKGRERERGRELFESPDLNPLNYLFVGLDKERSFSKEKWIQQTNCWFAFWMLMSA